jgi:hypothetical protein
VSPERQAELSQAAVDTRHAAVHTILRALFLMLIFVAVWLSWLQKEEVW